MSIELTFQLKNIEMHHKKEIQFDLCFTGKSGGEKGLKNKDEEERKSKIRRRIRREWQHHLLCNKFHHFRQHFYELYMTGKQGCS